MPTGVSVVGGGVKEGFIEAGDGNVVVVDKGDSTASSDGVGAVFMDGVGVVFMDGVSAVFNAEESTTTHDDAFVSGRGCGGSNKTLCPSEAVAIKRDWVS